MTRTEFLANRLQEVLLSGRWIANTNFRQLITSVNWQQATHKISSVNTIAALTFHLNYYTEGILKVFSGGPLDIKDKYSFDLPPVESETDWSKLVNAFLGNAEAFVQQVRAMPEENLDLPFVDEKYGSYLRNIEGVIEHSYYHMGQVSILKKMILEAEKN